ncbi:uncharacterized protein LOC144408033 [Gasterosteus aculeatus]
MTVNICQYVFPALVVSIAAVLLCFYVRARRKRTAVATAPPPGAGSPPGLSTVSRPDGQTDEERHYDRFPPRYSTVDPPPPYSLFDPKLTGVWPGGSPPAYEMYPITLPLAPHHWATSTGRPRPTSPSPRGPPQPQRAATS